MNKLSVMGLVCGLTLSIGANAEQIFAKITAVGKNDSRILVSSKDLKGLKTGDLLALNEACTLEVMNRTQNKAVLSAELCENRGALKKGTVVALKTEASTQSANLSRANSAPSSETTRDGKSSRITPPVDTKASNGFRVGFVKSFLDGKAKLKDSNGFSASISGDVDHEFGIALGYADIPINAPGFNGRLLFSQYNNESNSIRLDGNGTYGVNEHVYFLGGLNIHKFTKNAADKLNMGLGFQAGAGFQVTQNFGLDLTYVNLNNSGDINGVNVDFNANGIELTLHGTF